MSVRIFWRCRLLVINLNVAFKWPFTGGLMLLLTSFLALARDTLEKRNVKDLELQAMPIIHFCYYTMGKTVKQDKSFQWEEKQNFIIVKNNNKNGRNILSIPSLAELPVQPTVHFEMMNRLERKTYSRCSCVCLWYLLHHALSRAVIQWK